MNSTQTQQLLDLCSFIPDIMQKLLNLKTLNKHNAHSYELFFLRIHFTYLKIFQIKMQGTIFCTRSVLTAIMCVLYTAQRKIHKARHYLLYKVCTDSDHVRIVHCTAKDTQGKALSSVQGLY